MVYCELIRQENGKAIYHFGYSTDDLSGEVAFFVEQRPAEIIKQPEHMYAPQYWLNHVVAKYRNEFSANKFRQRISYECG